jgi:hypothetical protein
MMIEFLDPLMSRAELHRHTDPVGALLGLPLQEDVVAPVGAIMQHAMQERHVERPPPKLPAVAAGELQAVLLEILDDLAERAQLPVQVEGELNRLLDGAVRIFVPAAT